MLLLLRKAMKFRYQKIPFHGHDPRKPLIPRPFLPVYLHNRERSTRSPYYALLDSGADNVLLPLELAKEVGIEDITQGWLEPIVGVAGQQANVYYHNLAMQIVGDSRRLELPVGFSELIYIPLLGRTFFRYFRLVVFNEEKEEVELKI